MMSAPEDINGAIINIYKQNNNNIIKKKKLKRPRKPTAHEDVVEGFTFLAFKNYEELQRAVKLGGEDNKKKGEGGVGGVSIVGVSVSTNTSPLTPKNKVKVPHKHKPKKLMDQENGEGSSKPFITKKHKDKERLAKHARDLDEKGESCKISTEQVSKKEGSSSTGDNIPEVKVGEAPFFKATPPPPSPPLIGSDPPTTNTTTPNHSANGHHHGEGAAGSNTPNPTPKVFFTPYATNAITRVGVDCSKSQVIPPVPPPVSSKSLVFGSIVRLLDSPTTSSSSSNRSSPGGGLPPRNNNNHSPPTSLTTEDRDSYSSNVSSLSRSSVTPVSAPPNLSPQLPYSKAANWLSSSVVPVPRPTPPLGSSPFTSPAMFAPMHLQPSPDLQGTSTDMVRRDLESRINGRELQQAPQISLLPPNSMASSSSLYPPPPMFKEVVKMESPLYRVPYNSPPFNGFMPQTPFAPPPSQLPSYPSKKTGRWNAMHVRIAWEIYQHQHKGSSCPPPLSRAPPPLSHLFRAPPPQLYQQPPRPHDIYSSMVHAQQSFDQSLFLSHSLGGMRYPSYGGGITLPYPPLSLPSQDPWARLGSRGWSEVKRSTSPFRERSPVRLNGGESSSSRSDDKSSSRSSSSSDIKPHSSRMFPTTSPLPSSLYSSPYPNHPDYHTSIINENNRERELQQQQRLLLPPSSHKELKDEKK